MRGKFCQKFGALRFLHAGGLAQRVNGGAKLCKSVGDLLHIAVAGEKRQIVAGLGAYQLCQQLGDLCDAAVAVLVAGADVAGTPQPQIFPRKGAAQCHRLGVGNAAKILIVSGGGECGAEQHRRAPLGKVLRQKGAGV